MRGKRRMAALAALAALGAVYLANASWLAPASDAVPVLLAHRGIAQRFDTADLRNVSCTAARMLPPRHGYL